MPRTAPSASRRMASVAIGIIALTVASALCGSSAFAAASPTYPKPSGNVNDFVGVLSSEDKANLDALIDAVLRQTGTTFAIAIVPDHGDESLEMYAANLYEKWGIGQKGQDKGLLIVVSMKEHDFRAEVGYGLEPVITDARAGECLDKMTPYFADGEYGKGLYAGLLAAAQYVAKDAGVTLNIKPATRDYEGVGAPPPSLSLPLGLLAAFVGIPALLAAFLGLRGRRCPRCGARLTVTDRVVQNATYEVGGLAMRVLHCAKCGYHDEKPYRTSRLSKPPGGGIGIPPVGGPFWGGLGGGRTGGGFSGPRGFGGGRSGGGGASRKW